MRTCNTTSIVHISTLMPDQAKDKRQSHKNDPDDAMGAVTQDRPGQPNNTADFTEQIDHRDQRSIKKDSDTDFPEPGNNPEYSMQKQDDPKKQGDKILNPRNHPDANAPSDEVDQDPGERQKENQNQKKDDDLAA
jgi:hypothetical protein